MKILETDHWCVLLPPEWRAEHDDDVVRIADSDDIGEIELTTLCKDVGDVQPEELEAMARGESPEITDWQSATLGAFSGWVGDFRDDGAYIREWYLAASNVLLYVTYICDEEDAAMDASAVVELLDTLVLGDSLLVTDSQDT
ncbi:hypothetical protein [Luminiphilus syltensis]|uniref:hypothetical protein n=1 Tax=Luminiphilus syltensis TaxID=1341119 RepID=UPI0002FA8480|nr:hypothetical protein [Luminiphilus syltensis]